MVCLASLTHLKSSAAAAMRTKAAVIPMTVRKEVPGSCGSGCVESEMVAFRSSCAGGIASTMEEGRSKSNSRP